MPITRINTFIPVMLIIIGGIMIWAALQNTNLIQVVKDVVQNKGAPK